MMESATVVVCIDWMRPAAEDTDDYETTVDQHALQYGPVCHQPSETTLSHNKNFCYCRGTAQRAI